MELNLAECQELLPPSRRHLVGSGGNVVADFAISKFAGLLIVDISKVLFIAPYSRNANLSRAKAGEGVSTQFLGAQMPSGLRSDFRPSTYQRERSLSVDQTNESFVIDESIIIKWHLVVANSIGNLKEKQLANNEFPFSPKLLGNIYWKDFVIADINEYINNTSDGWTWCVAKAKEGDSGEWIDCLAELTKQMHINLKPYIHGDFHVGQILKLNGENKFWVIDFEGDPLQTFAEKLQETDAIKDIVAMCSSFFHAGAIAIKNGAQETMVKKWITNSANEYLRQLDYIHLNLSDLYPAIFRREEREIRYAESFLPQWRYAPEFAIRYLRELGYGSE